VFELAEVPLDDIALPVDRRVDRALNLSVALGRDVGATAVRGDQVDNGARVVTPVRDERAGGLEASDQGFDGSLVRGLSGREHDPQRQAVLIDQSIDLGA